MPVLSVDLLILEKQYPGIKTKRKMEDFIMGNLGNTIDRLYLEYMDALARKVNVAQAKALLTNTMLNNVALIAEALSVVEDEVNDTENMEEISELKQRIAALEDELYEAQSTINDLENQVDDLIANGANAVKVPNAVKVAKVANAGKLGV